MSDALPLDPFGPTANPQLYVPRAATERALDQMAILLGPEGHRLVLLTGPPGMGKTQLLRMLVERLPREVAPLYLPIASLPIDGLCAFALAELRVPCVGDPAERLVEHAREGAASGRRLVLLCDDASALGGAVSKLAGLVAEAGGGLAAVLACDEARAGPLRTALGPAVPEVSLAEPMSLVETTRYVRVRLGVAEISPLLWRCFDPPTLEHIHREARGVPRCVNQEAGALLRSLAERSLNGRQEPAVPAEAPPPPVRAPDAAAPVPAARPEEPPIPPLRAARSHRRRYRALRVVELGLATLVAGLVVMLVVRSGVPPLVPFDEPSPRSAAPATEPTPPRPDTAESTSAESAAPPPPVSGGPPAVEAEEPPARAPIPTPTPPPAPPPVSTAPAPAPETPPAEPTAQATVPAPTPRPEASVPESAAATPAPAPTPPSRAAAGPPSPPAVASAPPPVPAAPAPPAAPEEAAPPSQATPEEAAGRSPRSAPAGPEATAASTASQVSVNVNADPWAQVEIDGRPVGVTPLAGLRLAPGDHVFRASLPDGRVIERTVRIGAERRFVHFP